MIIILHFLRRQQNLIKNILNVICSKYKRNKCILQFKNSLLPIYVFLYFWLFLKIFPTLYFFAREKGEGKLVKLEQTMCCLSFPNISYDLLLKQEEREGISCIIFKAKLQWFFVLLISANILEITLKMQSFSHQNHIHFVHWKKTSVFSKFARNVSGIHFLKRFLLS